MRPNIVAHWSEFDDLVLLDPVLWDLVNSYVDRSPVREFSFTTIATPTRGGWWDSRTHSLCAARQKQIQSVTTDKVTFGVDISQPQHIGFAPETTGIVWHERYSGSNAVSNIGVFRIIHQGSETEMKME